AGRAVDHALDLERYAVAEPLRIEPAVGGTLERLEGKDLDPSTEDAREVAGERLPMDHAGRTSHLFSSAAGPRYRGRASASRRDAAASSSSSASSCRSSRPCGPASAPCPACPRSEERRVGKECRTV